MIWNDDTCCLIVFKARSLCRTGFCSAELIGSSVTNFSWNPWGIPPGMPGEGQVLGKETCQQHMLGAQGINMNKVYNDISRGASFKCGQSFYSISIIARFHHQLPAWSRSNMVQFQFSDSWFTFGHQFHILFAAGWLYFLLVIYSINWFPCRIVIFSFAMRRLFELTRRLFHLGRGYIM